MLKINSKKFQKEHKTNMKIFIIGSNSFMGNSFINYIYNRNYTNIKIIGASRTNQNNLNLNSNMLFKKKNFKFFKIDLNKDLKKLILILKKEKPNIIYNFAAQSIVQNSWDAPLDWYKTNLLSNVKLLDYLKNVDYLDKYIQSSTPEVYGSTKGKIIESFNYFPSTPYASSKASIDMYLKNLFDNYKFPVLFTRASNIYGPGQKIYKLIPKALISIMLGKKIKLDGGGLSKRSFIYSDDVSSALMKINSKGKAGEIYHITNEKMHTIKDIVKIICKNLNVEFEDFTQIATERPGKDFSYNMSSKKIKKIGWKPEANIFFGIDHTKSWIMNNFEKLKKNKLVYEHKS
ncbi:dTDPglucose 4,6-dehydratase [Candidatus Pelagibacter ubique HTCC1002]|nr:GDP-mannose 4,6-dehydratase [Candidatus Pelagibacter ubique]EAS84776.1 dTDPglucose 4,6-dehydratase [Candidatus Pelagibacter ubique HTCC1002]